MFCKVCGRNIGEHFICPYCDALQGTRPADEYIDLSSGSVYQYSRRTAAIAGFLQLFLGAFGIGRFYLGYKLMGILQILASVFSFGIAGFIWGFCDGLMILNGKEKYDCDGKLLQ